MFVEEFDCVLPVGERHFDELAEILDNVFVGKKNTHSTECAVGCIRVCQLAPTRQPTELELKVSLVTNWKLERCIRNPDTCTEPTDSLVIRNRRLLNKCEYVQFLVISSVVTVGSIVRVSLLVLGSLLSGLHSFHGSLH